jgi:hypothetical protein
MIIQSRTRALAFTALLLALPANAAFAQEAGAVADRLKAVLAEQNLLVDWAGVEQSGSQIVLKGVTVGLANQPASNPIGDVTLDGVTEENGGYTIGTVTFPGFSTNENGLAFDMASARLSGLRVPPAGSAEPAAAFLMYDSAELASVSVKRGDAEVFGLTNLHFEMTPPADGKAMAFTGAADKFTVDLTTVPDPQSKAVIDALGYQKLAGNIQMAGSWQPSDGMIELSKYDLAVEDVGTLGMTFSLGGYTPAFVKSLQDMQKKMAAAPAGQDQSAQGIAMLGLMQQLTLSGVSVRFDDDSLTGRVLDFYAKQQNVSVNDLKNQVKAIMPFATAQLNNPELNSQIVNAVNAFIDSPGSIEIAAEPAEPVPFAQLAASGMSNPIELTKTLGLRVSANQPKGAAQ